MHQTAYATLQPLVICGVRRMRSEDKRRGKMDTDTPCIGSRRELFIDPYLIERFEGAALRLHPPQPQEVSVSFDAPWEEVPTGSGLEICVFGWRCVGVESAVQRLASRRRASLRHNRLSLSHPS